MLEGLVLGQIVVPPVPSLPVIFGVWEPGGLEMLGEFWILQDYRFLLPQLFVFGEVAAARGSGFLNILLHIRLFFIVVFFLFLLLFHFDFFFSFFCYKLLNSIERRT